MQGRADRYIASGASGGSNRFAGRCTVSRALSQTTSRHSQSPATSAPTMTTPVPPSCGRRGSQGPDSGLHVACCIPSSCTAGGCSERCTSPERTDTRRTHLNKMEDRVLATRAFGWTPLAGRGLLRVALPWCVIPTPEQPSPRSVSIDEGGRFRRGGGGGGRALRGQRLWPPSAPGDEPTISPRVVAGTLSRWAPTRSRRRGCCFRGQLGPSDPDAPHHGVAVLDAGAELVRLMRSHGGFEDVAAVGDRPTADMSGSRQMRPRGRTSPTLVARQKTETRRRMSLPATLPGTCLARISWPACCFDKSPQNADCAYGS